MTRKPLPLWIYLLAGPLLFAGAILSVSLVLGVTGTAPDLIADRASTFAPHILLAVLALLGLICAVTLDVRAIWRAPVDPLRDLMLGATIGAVIGLAYFGQIQLLLEHLQRDIGDYVPPGSVSSTLTGHLPLFVLANLMLAPLVEETLYRGHIQTRLAARFGPAAAVLLGSLFFGLLHWTGGAWYMLATAALAGLPFALLTCWRGSILAAFSAHFTLNLLETLIALAS